VAPRLSQRAQAILFVALVAVAIGGLLAYVQATTPPPITATGRVSASLLVDGGTWTIRYGPVETTNNTPFSLLKEASQRLGFSVDEVYYTLPSAVFVTAINGTVNGQGGHYWQYWVNGVYGDVGADQVALSNGDTVAWRFTTDQGGASG